MIIDNRYNLGQTVYLLTDQEQLSRIVTFIKICPGNIVCYELSCGSHSSEHYDMEISGEKNLVNAL